MGMTVKEDRIATRKAANDAANIAQNTAKKAVNRADAAAANAKRNEALKKKNELQAEANALAKKSTNYYNTYCNPSTGYNNTMNSAQQKTWNSMLLERNAKQAAADAVVVPPQKRANGSIVD